MIGGGEGGGEEVQNLSLMYLSTISEEFNSMLQGTNSLINVRLDVYSKTRAEINYFLHLARSTY